MESREVRGNRKTLRIGIPFRIPKFGGSANADIMNMKDDPEEACYSFVEDLERLIPGNAPFEEYKDLCKAFGYPEQERNI